MRTDAHLSLRSRGIAHAAISAAVLIMVVAAGNLKWQDGSMRDKEMAGVEAVQAAKDGAIALLSYERDTVESDLGAARTRLTGQFLDAYTALTHEVVIPGSKRKAISAVASVPAAAPASIDGSHATVLLFINQSVFVGRDAPANTASSVRVTLDRVDGRWLISGFDPV